MGDCTFKPKTLNVKHITYTSDMPEKYISKIRHTSNNKCIGQFTNGMDVCPNTLFTDISDIDNCPQEFTILSYNDEVDTKRNGELAITLEYSE